MSLTVSQPRVLEFKDYQGEVTDTADMIVVGSGPGGAVVAKELSELGHEVILLEEGPPFKQKILRRGASMCRLYREASLLRKIDVSNVQAIALGGGSVVNPQSQSGHLIGSLKNGLSTGISIDEKFSTTQAG